MCQRDLAIVIIATLGHLPIYTGCLHSHIITVVFFRQGCMGKCCSVLGNAKYLLVLPLRDKLLPYLIITTPFHFVLFKFKDLVAKQHPITCRHMYIHTYIYMYMLQFTQGETEHDDTTINWSVAFLISRRKKSCYTSNDLDNRQCSLSGWL